MNQLTEQAATVSGRLVKVAKTRHACIRGIRVTVGMIVGQVGAGHTIEELLADWSVKTFLKRCATPRGLPNSVKLLFPRMKLLVDMNLSPRWIPFLLDARCEEVHWSTAGKADGSDSEIMAFAAASDLVLLASRRLFRPADAVPLTTVRSLAYLLPWSRKCWNSRSARCFRCVRGKLRRFNSV